MLKLEVIRYSDGKTVNLKLSGNGTIIHTQIFSNHAYTVADYINHYEPDEVKYNQAEFALLVEEELEKLNQ